MDTLDLSPVDPPLVGVGYRRPIAEWIRSGPASIGCLEITAEHFYDRGEDVLEELRESYAMSVHGLGLSLGTPGPIDPIALDAYRRVADIADARWISEHLAFTRTADVDLGHLNPIPLTRSSLETMVDHSRELMDICQRPLLLENITSFLRIPEEIDESDFINRLCSRSGAGMLLDVTNLLINSRNHRFDPIKWLHKIDPVFIRQLHIVGYSVVDGIWQDYHSEPIQDDLLELATEVISYAPVESIILERDGRFPGNEDLEKELTRLEHACETAQCR